MNITAEQLAEIMACPIERANTWYIPLSSAMQEFEINTPARVAMFLANVGCESDRFRYTQEIWGPTAQQEKYDDRDDLGNTKQEAIDIAYDNNDTPGHFYKGRGLLQTTGYNNFCEVRDALGIDCVTNPKLLMEPMNAARSAAYFWKIGAGLHLSRFAKSRGLENGVNLNDLADAGEFLKTVYAINGGENGLPLRETIYNRAVKVLS